MKPSSEEMDWMGGGWNNGASLFFLTSGKVPLEKTLDGNTCQRMMMQRRARTVDGRNSHQQTGFTASTIANDDQLSANLSHGVCVGGWVVVMRVFREKTTKSRLVDEAKGEKTALWIFVGNGGI